MQIAELFEKAIKNSEFAGEFEYSKLFSHIFESKYSAIATSENKKKSIILIFVSGDPQGAAQVDEFGLLYGDKVVYSLDKSATYKLFLIEKKLAESLAARTRIFDKKYLKQDNFSSSLSDLKSFSTRPVKVRIIVLKEEKPAPGLKVSMIRDKSHVNYEFTSSDGSAGFVLQSGDYKCNIIDENKKEHSFLIKLEGKDSVITIKI